MAENRPAHPRPECVGDRRHLVGIARKGSAGQQEHAFRRPALRFTRDGLSRRMPGHHPLHGGEPDLAPASCGVSSRWLNARAGVSCRKPAQTSGSCRSQAVAAMTLIYGEAGTRTTPAAARGCVPSPRQSLNAVVSAMRHVRKSRRSTVREHDIAIPRPLDASRFPAGRAAVRTPRWTTSDAAVNRRRCAEPRRRDDGSIRPRPATRLLSKITQLQVRMHCRMMTYERSQKLTLVARLNEKPARLIMVTGPRRTGKTTLVRQVLHRLDRPCRYLAVDEPDPTTLPPFPLAGDAQEAGLAETAGRRQGERDMRWLVRRWEEARIEAGRSERGFRSGPRRDPENRELVRNGQGNCGMPIDAMTGTFTWFCRDRLP